MRHVQLDRGKALEVCLLNIIIQDSKRLGLEERLNGLQERPRLTWSLHINRGDDHPTTALTEKRSFIGTELHVPQLVSRAS